ncbi:MAG: sigma-70 family RNA polymerase sigma factor [Comamonadaceae bacterium]|nr:MAG: sigma-70 family RNA polymerase sigma factor [Comamonadaceae bacterium]
MAVHHYRELLNYFTRSVNDRHAAADVVQEAYLRVLALQSRGVQVLQPRALLFHTGRNIVARQAVRHATERRILDTLALVAADSAPSMERDAIARQQLRLLVERLETMPAKRRDVFLLVRVHGHSYGDAAAHMGISLAAVEKHVVRAILDIAGYRPAAA